MKEERENVASEKNAEKQFEADYLNVLKSMSLYMYFEIPWYGVVKL